MEIVELDREEWRPWEPPFWLIALGLSLAIVVGLIQTEQVQDPRLRNAPAPTNCVPRPITQNPGQSYIWTVCP